MLERVVRNFEVRFGRPPEFGAHAPGRVNLIGEHTDYNGGLVLPFAVDRETWVVGAFRNEPSARVRRIRVWADDLGEGCEFDPDAPERAGERGGAGHWANYIQGVCWALAQRGAELPACDLLVSSSLPQQAGLSSSAALGVATAVALDAAMGLGWHPHEWARLAHQSESEFVGVACGIMDHFVSALAREGCAMRLDCSNEEVRHVPVPEEDFAVLVVDSGVRRALAASTSVYRERVAECRAGLEQARAAGLTANEVDSLRALQRVPLARLEEALDAVCFRRVRHVISENTRVETVCQWLEAANRSETGALDALGERLSDGQRSLREDFEVSIPELDFLCERGDHQPGVYGSRLTGAGMGGCTLHLVAPAAIPSAEAALRREFESQYGRRPQCWSVRPAAGAERIEDL